MSQIQKNPEPSLTQSKLALATKRKEERAMNDFLYCIDETPDFHDPYSDLNLFLSSEIKEEMRQCGLSKKWSLRIQEKLIEKITPEFKKRFPKYRLGIAALKKTWEKIAFYTDQIQQQEEALTQEGKLNIYFFIKENLKKFHHMQSYSELEPYHYASQLAYKMSECIAAIDGKKPKFDQLTKTIWGTQRHLLKNIIPSRLRSPYDENDRIDKFIVKTLLELTAIDPQISQVKLEDRIKQELRSFLHLPIFASSETLTCYISALLADKFYPVSKFHSLYDADEKHAICNFLKRHLSLYESSSFSAEHLQLVRRTTALYTLASTMSKEISEEALSSAIEAVYPVVKEDRPQLDQSVYAFIFAELLLYRNATSCYSLEFMKKTIIQAYEEAKKVPEMGKENSDLLEVLIWKTLSEKEHLLSELPFVIGQKIEQEIAKTLIEHPHQTFSSVVKHTLGIFKMIKELSIDQKWESIEQKIHNWSLQGDMLCRWIKIPLDHPLLRLIMKRFGEYQNREHHEEFISVILQEYLKTNPHLAVYSKQIICHIWALYKYAWYALFSKAEESSFERFIKWHHVALKCQKKKLSEEEILGELSTIVKKVLPLFTFDPVHWKKRLFTSIDKESADYYKWYA